MEHEKVERLNELARKMKTIGLTEEEKQEQARLRLEYLEGWRTNLKAALDNTIIRRPDGTETRLTPKDPQ